jgi:3-oxoadipate enol-lactonase
MSVIPLEGQGEEVVVLLHGELNDSSSWQKTFEALNSRYRVLRYDRTPGTSLETHREQLEVLLEAHDLDRVHLVGHSGGGVLAYVLAGHYPDRIASLTLVDSLGKLDVPLEVKVRSVLAALDAGGAGLAYQVATPWLFGADFLTHAQERLQAAQARAAQMPVDVLRSSIEYVLALGDQRKWLRAIECPVLIMVGSDDSLTPMRYSHELVEWVKPGLGVLVTITGAGHNAPIEKPDEFNRILLGFLERSKDFTKPLWNDDDDDLAEYQDYGTQLEN